jgi:anti-sigma regulatory factor (Ser/Thr protein kinase)
MTSVRMLIEEPSQTAGARREARRLAMELGFGEVNAEKVAIVVTEAATNLLKHGSGGEIFLQISAGATPLLEVLAMDRGQGFADLSACSRDGYSTAGTPGNGLGSIERNSDFSDLYSLPGRGTVLIARFSGSDGSAAQKLATQPSRLAALQTAKPGEDVCGDAWAAWEEPGRQVIIVADGLGHGPEAELAARTAVALLDENADNTPKDLLEIVHHGLRHTRGAAVAVAELNQENRTIRFAGLGNIAATVCESDALSRHLVSLNGTAGMESRTTMREFEYPWPEGSALIMHSDGLTARWEFNQYPGLLQRDAGLICGVLLRDFSRGNDDATVVAVK